MDASAKKTLTWRVPVLAAVPGIKDVWRGTVAASAPADLPGAGGVLINDGQAGYFRSLYDSALLKDLTARFRQLSSDNQMGLLHDTRALGYAGYEPLTDFLNLAEQADPSMDPKVQDVIAGQLAGIDDLYRGLPGQARFRTFSRNLLAPLFAKVGWDAAAGENQNVTLLRATLLQALSQFDDPSVIAEARKRFAAYLKDSAHIAADTRRSMLVIVAQHADAKTWEQLHALVKTEKDTMARQELYALLGSARDRALAEKALSLALTQEAPITTRPSIVKSVSGEYPEMAFDFVNRHLAAVNAWLERDSRNQFVPNLVSNGNDPKLVPRLKSYAAGHIPPTARNAAVKSESSITFNAQVRAQRLPDVDRWLATRRIQ